MNISTPAGPGGLTLGQMADQVSRALIGVPASDSIDNPSKTQIIDELNNAQFNVCSRHQDWTFLNRLLEVDGYQLDSSTTQITRAYTSLYSVDFGTGGTAASNTDYAATKVTFSTPALFSAVTMDFGVSATGFAGWSGSIQILICNSTSGTPDVATPVAVSDILTVSNNVVSTGQLLTTTPQALSFTITQSLPVVVGDYFIVARIIYDSEGGRNTLKVGRATYTGGAIYHNTVFLGSTWTTDTANDLACTFTYYVAEYTSEIKVPFQMSKIYQIYDTVGGTVINVLTEDRDPKNMADPIHGNTFRIVGIDEGFTYVQIPEGLKVLKWNVEGMIYANRMTNDTDTSVLPVSYRRLLVYDAIITLRSLGYGLTSPDNLAILGNKLAQGMSDMEMHLRRLPPKGISAPRETSTSTLQGDTRRFDRSQAGRPRFANQRRY